MECSIELSGLSGCEDDCAATVGEDAVDSELEERRADGGEDGFELHDEATEVLATSVPVLVGMWSGVVRVGREVER